MPTLLIQKELSPPEVNSQNKDLKHLSRVSLRGDALLLTVKIVSMFHSKFKLFIVLLVLTTTVASTLEAQRRVIRTPHRKVVVRNTPRAHIYYSRPAPRVRVVRTLPVAAFRLTHAGAHYYYHGGLYYRPHSGGYIVVSAPVGLRIRTLPVGYARIVVTGRPYYYYSGVFYVQQVGGNDSYEVVTAPVWAIVKELPKEAEKVKIDGEKYYAYNETLYAKTKGGYEVVGSVSIDNG